MDHFVADLRYAVRGLVRTPGYVFASAAALTLGIGAVMALFAVLWAVLLRPLPYRDPDRLVTILHGDAVSAPVSPADYLDFRRDVRSFTDIAAAQAWGANLDADGRAERLDALRVSGTLFEVLGVSAERGRMVTEEDAAPGRGRVAVIAHGLWVRRFGADPAIVGREIRLNGELFTIVGVMPAEFRFAPFWQTRAELWVPLVLDRRSTDRSGRSLRLFARLRDGLTLDAARAELNAETARLASDYPETDRGLITGAMLLSEKAAGSARPMVLAIFGLSLAVLLIACANVATLTLARVLARGRELAVRTALGAGRLELARLLVVEGLVIGAAGAGGGLTVASVGLRALAALLPRDALPPHVRLELPLPMVALGVAVAIAASLAASIVPLFQLSERDLVDAVRDGRTLSGSRSRHIRSALVAVEVALALVLVISATLLGRTLLTLRHVNPGFATEGVVAMSVSLQGSDLDDPPRQRRFFSELVGVLDSQPGVAAAGAINHLPLAGDLWSYTYAVDGAAAASPGEEPHAIYRVTAAGYFRAMQQQRLAGRDFTTTDSDRGLPVAIVSEAFARRWWPHESALGHRVTFAPMHDGDVPRTIVGVVANAQQHGLTEPPLDEIYVPLGQRPDDDYGRASMTLVVRGSAAPALLLETTRNAVARANPRAAVYEEATMVEVVDRETWRERLASGLVGAFSVIALALAALGVHGIVSHAVSARVREFGVRLALGASPGGLPRLAMRDAAGPVLTGLGGGLLLALAVTRLMLGWLFGVSPADPMTLAGSTAIFAMAALGAAWWPASRIARLDPSVALRQE